MLRLITLAIVAMLAVSAQAQLALQNGNFDADPSLGDADDPVNSPTGWFQHYTQEGSWSDFRFGSVGRGGWTANAISLGQNFDPDPGPEDGYYYTRLGAYGGELSARVNGFGYNRSDRANPAGDFVVSVYSTPAGSFTAANGADVAGAGRLLGTTTVDIDDLTGLTPQSRAFQLDVPLSSAGLTRGDELWLHIGDGPDDANLETLDEPMIDNLTLTVVVPEPGTVALAAAFAAAALARPRRRAA